MFINYGILPYPTVLSTEQWDRITALPYLNHPYSVTPYHLLFFLHSFHPILNHTGSSSTTIGFKSSKPLSHPTLTGFEIMTGINPLPLYLSQRSIPAKRVHTPLNSFSSSNGPSVGSGVEVEVKPPRLRPYTSSLITGAISSRAEALSTVAADFLQDRYVVSVSSVGAMKHTFWYSVHIFFFTFKKSIPNDN